MSNIRNISKKYKHKVVAVTLALILLISLLTSVFAVTTTYDIGSFEINEGETSVVTTGSTTGNFTQSAITIPAGIAGTQIKAGDFVISNGATTPATPGGVTWSLSSIPGGASPGTYVITWTQTSIGNGDIVNTKITLVIKSNVVAPSVTTGTHSSVTSNSAIVSGSVTNDGGQSVSYGIAYSTSSNPTTGTTVGSGTGTRSFNGSLSGLSANTTYYYRAFASNSAGVTYGNEGSFTTLPSPPTVSINNATGITSTEATVSANASGLSISAKGFSGDLSYSSGGAGSGNYSNTFTGLTPNTYYSLRAYATNTGGTGYSSYTNFYTLANLPSITSVVMNGSNVEISVDANSNPASTTYYIEASTVDGDFSSVEVVANWLTLSSGKIVFADSLLNARDTEYFYRVKARNGSSVETAFSADSSDHLLSMPPVPSAPTVIPSALGEMTINGYDVVKIDSPEITYNIYRDNVLILGGSATNSISVTDTGLATNVQYGYKVEAINNSGTSVASGVTSKYSAAAVPDVISVQAQQNGDLILTIDKKDNPNATEYLIEESTTSDFSGDVTIERNWSTFGAGINTYTVAANTVDDDKTYYYRVKARNGDNIETNYGNLGSALTVPSVPLAPTVTVDSDEQITLSWTQVNGIDTVIITYDIYVNINNGGFAILESDLTVADQGNPSYIHNTLTPNTIYEYKVQARNASGVSNDSPSDQDVTLASIPDVLEVNPEANGNITLTVEEYGNPNITAYYVEKATDPLFSDAVLALTWTNPDVDHNLTITGLDRGTLYYFRVKARNSVNVETGFGPIIGSIRTIPADLLIAPVATIVSSNQINLSWNSVTGATTYDLYRNGSFLINVSGEAFSDTSLNPNDDVIYTIKGVNTSGESINASPASTIKYTYTVTPALSILPNENGTEVDVTITDDDNEAGVQYSIEYDTSSDFSSASSTAWSSNQAVNINGLSQGTIYYLRVRARNGNNGANTSYESPWSTSESIMTALQQVNQPTITPDSAVALDVSWDSVVGASNYKIYRDTVYVGTVSGLTYTDNGLKSNKSYSYTISAVNADGEENLQSIAGEGRTRAAYPESLSVIDRTATSVDLEISPFERIGDTQKYQLIIKDKASVEGDRILAWSRDLQYKIEGLTTGNAYEVWVGVKNEDGLTEPATLIMETLYSNRPVQGTLINDADQIRSEIAGFNQAFELKLKISDPDMDVVTVSAELNGLTKTMTLTAPATEPADANVTLSWDVYSLEEGNYTNIVVSFSDPYDYHGTSTYSSTLIVDKTAPIITLTGDATVFLLVDEVYTDAGATVLGDDGNGVVVTGDNIDTSLVGLSNVTFTSTDNAGNEVSVMRNVHVVESVAIEAITVDQIASQSVSAFGEILSLGKVNNANEYGFVYGEADQPTIADNKVNLKGLDPAIIGAYSTQITGLTESTTYYIRGYILDGDNGDTPIYTDSISFDTIAAVDDVAKFAVDEVHYTVVEGNTITVSVNRTVITSGEMTVDYALIDGTAIGGTDYNSDSGSITFADGEVSKTIDIITIDNGIFNAEKDLVFELSSPSDGGVITSSQARISITNDDPKNSENRISAFDLTGSVGPAVINDGAGTITITVANGTNLIDISPSTLTLLSNVSSVSPAIGVLRDFSSPLAYIVTAEDGTSKRYIVNVTEQALDSDADLANLTVTADGQNQTLSPGFTSSNTSYSITVANDISLITLIPTLSSVNATYEVTKNDVLDDEDISLDVGIQTVKVKVTAQDLSEKTYTIQITRQAAAQSSNAYLSSLNLSEDGMSPEFDKSKNNYVLTVPNNVSNLEINTTTEDPSSGLTIEVNGQSILSGDSFNLNEGANVVRVIVTSTDGTKNVYAVAITRSEAVVSSGGSLPSGSIPTTPPTSNEEEEDNSSDDRKVGVPVEDENFENDVKKKIEENPKNDDREQTGPIIQVGNPKASSHEKDSNEDISKNEPDASPTSYEKTTTTLSKEDFGDEDLENYGVGKINPETGEITPVIGKIIDNGDGTVDIEIYDQDDGYYTILKNNKDLIDKNSSNHWAYDVATKVAGRYALNEILGQNIDLSSDLTRKEAAALMVRLMGIDVSRYDLPIGFSDVNKEDELSSYLTVAYRFGIISGYGDNTFRPDQIISREEMAVIAENTISYMKLLDLRSTNKQYIDEGEFSLWSYGSIYTLTDNGIFEGTPNASFLPKRELSKGEMIQIFLNLENFFVKEE
ncbi:MAG: fibronectin type III domain-containing protein [Clostridia bacterium]|nr:fibronectin type III domain-containing protein [Clostridia bacterium]